MPKRQSNHRARSRVGLFKLDPADQRTLAEEAKQNGVSATSRKFNIPRDLVVAAVANADMREGSVLLVHARVAAVTASTSTSDAPPGQVA